MGAITELWHWVDQMHDSPLDEFDIKQLGQLRMAMLEATADVEAQLHAAMRERRADGATLQEIIAASGYRSIDAVRKILDPAVKGKAALARRRKNAGRARAAANRVVLTEDAAEASALAGWSGDSVSSAK